MGRILASTLLALALVATACSSAIERPYLPHRPADPEQVVFQTYTGGGLTPIDFFLGIRPGITVYGNGDAYVVRDEPVSGRYPGRPLAFVRGAVPSDVLDDLIRAARESGLFGGADFGQPQITDAPGTSMTFRPGRAPASEANAYALSIESADRGLSLVQRANRTALRGFKERLRSSVVLGDAQVPQAWVPDRIDVTDTDTDSAIASGNGGEGSDPVTTWPGPPFATVLTRQRGSRACGVLSGATAHEVYAAARAHAPTRWRDRDLQADRALVIRALLPGERGCE